MTICYTAVKDKATFKFGINCVYKIIYNGQSINTKQQKIMPTDILQFFHSLVTMYQMKTVVVN